MLLCTPFSAPVSCLGSALLILPPSSVPWAYFILWSFVLCSSYLGNWPSITCLSHPEMESTDLPGFLLTWPCKAVILLTALFPSIVLHFVFSLSPCSLLVFPVQVCCGDIWPLVLALSEGLWYLVCYCRDISWPNSWLQGDLEVCLWTELRAGRIAVVTVCHIGVLRRSCHTCRNEKPHISLTEFPKAVQQSFKLNSHR